MDRFENIQELLSARVLGSTICCLWALFIVCQPRLRLKVFLALAVVTSTLSRLVDLEYPADMAKAFFPLFFGFLILAAFMHPGPKRRLPWFSWVLFVLAGVSFIYIRNVLDFQVAFILRTQWLMITFTGLLVVRTIHDQKSLRYVLEGLLLGLGGGVLLTGSQFVVNPAHAFSLGFGRFSPYGANPNQIGLLFSMTIPIALYLTIGAKSNTVRLGLVVIIAIAAMQSALTLSRASMLLAALPSLPTLFVLCRHPGVIILAIVCAYVVGSQTIDDLEGFDLEHISTDAVEARLDHTLDLLHVVEQRPMFGLLFAEFEHAVHDQINSHNAYVDLLYLGGYSLALPHFMLFVFGHFSAWLTWVNRRGSKFDPLAISMLAMFSFCVFIHGFVNGTILYPTYIWAFIHVLVLTFFLTNGLRSSMAVRRQSPVGRRDRAIPRTRPGSIPTRLRRPTTRHAMPPRPKSPRPRVAVYRPSTTRTSRPSPLRSPLGPKRIRPPHLLRPIDEQNER